ncbi:Glycerophosphoryl diester phosphodiesterase [Nocardioides dokdonensis FR1436]|uniref:Glycerophosphoryl diester phosphodiesterase n=1 Tax=Nocardioides dokdonensis FR1436 TaxID=1300347 RepID=A0A1A9GIS9_9ACTN|nr:glycerophosphodiester phosphodiesterase [Nocardioides dokdonensis]ANH37572.1 Glycerophosphoryl diester phosphodiesterase [Nocardioides dokdonensis FR1436]
MISAGVDCGAVERTYEDMARHSPTRMTRAVTTAALTLALASGGPAAQAEEDAAASTHVGDYRVVAHRGAPARHVTENTLPALERAVGTGASAVELDVSLTADGGFVLLHDATLDRTTTCRGPAVRRSLRWIRSHCRGVRGREPVPSLDAALAYLRGTDVDLLLEIKRHPGAEWDAAALTRLRAAVEKAGMRDRTLLLCFHAPTLALAEQTVPDLETQWIVTSWKQQVHRARRDPTTWVDGVNVWVRQLTRKRVRRLQAAGLLVLGRNTQARRDWARLRRYGVDGVMTDDVPGYRTWSRKQGQGR